MGMKRAAVTLTFAYFVAMAVAVTFPGLEPFNSIRPFVFGIPFVFAWAISWIVGALVVLALLYRAFHK